MYLIKAISNITDEVETIYVNSIDEFRKICTNESFNYYLYEDDRLIDNINNLEEE